MHHFDFDICLVTYIVIFGFIKTNLVSKLILCSKTNSQKFLYKYKRNVKNYIIFGSTASKLIKICVFFSVIFKTTMANCKIAFNCA